MIHICARLLPSRAYGWLCEPMETLYYSPLPPPAKDIYPGSRRMGQGSRISREEKRDAQKNKALAMLQSACVGEEALEITRRRQPTTSPRIVLPRYEWPEKILPSSGLDAGGSEV